MDLNQIVDRSEEGVVFEITNPVNGEVIYDSVGKEANPFYAKARGTDSKHYRAFSSARDSTDAAWLRKSGKKSLELSEEERIERIIDSLVHTIIELYVVENGKPIEQTAESYRDVFTRHAWLRNQLVTKIFNDSNFFMIA